MLNKLKKIIHFEWSVFTNTVMTKGHLFQEKCIE